MFSPHGKTTKSSVILYNVTKRKYGCGLTMASSILPLPWIV